MCEREREREERDEIEWLGKRNIHCHTIIILILHLSVMSVCESGRSREVIRPELKTFLFLHRWTWTIHFSTLLTFTTILAEVCVCVCVCERERGREKNAMRSNGWGKRSIHCHTIIIKINFICFSFTQKLFHGFDYSADWTAI